ncbi:MAG: hypothetical protein ACRD7E_23565 [Bryobacteraceae bacterium]
MNSSQLVYLFIWSLTSLLAPGSLIGATLFTHAFAPGAVPCEQTGTSDAFCTATREVTVDDTLAVQKTFGSAHSEFGFLSVSGSVELTNWDLTPFSVASGQGVARFSDTVTVFGSDAIAYLLPVWDTSDLYCIGNCTVFDSQFDQIPEFGNTLNLFASLGAGDPFGIVPEVSGSLRLLSIRPLDADLNPITGVRLFYTSESGAAYNVESASQIPEPASWIAAASGLAALILRGPGWRRSKRLSSFFRGRMRITSQGTCWR